MTVSVRLMFDNNQPLRRVRVRYRRGPASTKWVHQFADANGNLTMNRNPRRGERAINLRVYAENPTVRVTRPAGPVQRVAFQDVDARDGQAIIVPGGDVREEFLIANEAYALYQNSIRRFFPSDNPLGDAAANTDRRIKIRWPGITAGTAYTNPAPGQLAPVILLTRNGMINPATGGIILDELRGVLRSEMAHAVHFCQFGKQRRLELKLRYVDNLAVETVQDVAAGRNPGWNWNEQLQPLQAFVEAFDIFMNIYDNHVGSPTRDADTFSDIDAAPTAATFGDERVPSRICAVIFSEFAQAVGLEEAVDIYFQSRALRFDAFAGRVRRRFGANSAQFTGLQNAAAVHGIAV